MQPRLAPTERQKHHVHDHRREDRPRDRDAVFGLLRAAREGRVVGPEQPGEGGEDDDGEDGNYDTRDWVRRR
jgi:hypothetical protein